VTDPEKELREFVLRDLLDVALGNTDNHARNTSVLKWPDGRIELSPLYDFAPMILDRRMVARVSRWEDDRDFRIGGESPMRLRRRSTQRTPGVGYADSRPQSPSCRRP
jgi:hypothetical protein